MQARELTPTPYTCIKYYDTLLNMLNHIFLSFLYVYFVRIVCLIAFIANVLKLKEKETILWLDI